MRNLPQTVPSLSGTFSIHTRLALNPKMLKEPSSPSRAIVPSVKNCSKIEIFEWNEENSQHITMYKNNSRDSGKFKGCSPLQLYRKLKDLSSEVGYYSYTHRCMQAEENQRPKIVITEIMLQEIRKHQIFFGNV